MTGSPAKRRGYAAALLSLAAGAALGLVASTRTWGGAMVDDGLAATTEQVSGRELLPLGPAVALLALAAVVAVPATRRTGRRLVGAVLAAAGLLTAAWAVVIATDLRARIAQWVGAGAGGADVTAVQTDPGWAVLAAAAGVLIAGAGIAVLLRGPGWPAMGRRYERGPARTEPDDPSDLRAGRETWDALDRGEDPTS